jgi:signal transduction histidine kinase
MGMTGWGEGDLRPGTTWAMNATLQAPAEAPAGAHEGPLAALCVKVEPVAPDTHVADVGNRLLESRHDGLLSLPVVEGGRPVGSISRYDLMRVFLQPYGREVFGRRPIGSLMNRRPVVLPVGLSVEEAARRIAEGIGTPITEDFILTDADGAYLGTGVVLDVLKATENQLAGRSHELEQAYQRLKSSQSQLIQSEKMASLGQMVAGLAHEINTPLGYVRNNVELLREGLEGLGVQLAAQAQALAAWDEQSPPGAAPREAAQAWLAQAEAQADPALLEELPTLLEDTLHGLGQIGELVGNLKDFSRLDRSGAERADPRALLESALKIAGHILRRRNIEVVRDFAEVPAVECAPQQINQVLLNLLTNAAQAIEHEAGRIVLRTRRMQAPVPGGGGREVVAMVVEDNGKGIAEEHLSRIFDPFFTTKPVGEGTGLGLSISYRIVQQHGGSIRVASRPGAGTRFMVVLPVEATRGDAA